jgi:fimbrial chaperone protein
VGQLALCLAVCYFPSLVKAAGWDIDPVRIELSKQQQTASLTVKNTSDQPTSIQIHAMAWSQHNGKDVYIRTKEILVSPPIVKIAPNSQQIVRVALRRDASATKELTYRLILKELPPKQSPGFTGVKVALNVTLPVFVQSTKGDAVAKMEWDVLKTKDDQLKVSVRNPGNAHVQISEVALYVPGIDKSIAGESGSTYVLEGQTHEWMFPANSLDKVTNNKLRFTASTDANNIDTEIAIRNP